jgi:Swt1-like HEPN
MAQHYTIFYCLENHIREIISGRLKEAHGAGWWSNAVPEAVRKNADSNQKREIASGITPRSTELIDYSNFGELGEIIKTNWDLFGDMFRDIRALEKILGSLNTLRAPIAHCKPLAEDEIVRLHLSMRDWFRQMG